MQYHRQDAMYLCILPASTYLGVGMLRAYLAMVILALRWHL